MSKNITPYKDSVLGKKEQVAQMFDTISENYDGLNRVISFGIDVKWRKKVLQLVSDKNPKTVLDIATGTGDLAILMTNTTAEKIIGLDISAGMLEVGRNKIKKNEPVLFDLVHVHRGYVVDMTRMFSLGSLSQEWHQRLEDMLAVKDTVVGVLDEGGLCSDAWVEGQALAHELGHQDHLMGMVPDQSKFLGHSVGLQLDESPVVAAGFDRPLPIGGTMAIEPKVVHADGSIGSEDTWIRDEDGMRPVTADGAWPWLTEW